MSASTVGNSDKHKKRVSKFVKVVCKKLHPFKDIFTQKSDKTSKSVVSFKNHKLNVVFDSHFIRFRQNVLTTLCINDVEQNQIELKTKYLFLVKSPFASEQVIFCLDKKTEGNSQSGLINFLSSITSYETLDLEMAEFKMSASSDRKKFLEKMFLCKQYQKYLPLEDGASNSLTYLRTEIDSKAPMCWLDIQAWFVKQKQSDLRRISTGITKSKSDTCTQVDCKMADLTCGVQDLTRRNKGKMKRKVRYSAALEYVKNVLNAEQDSTIEIVIQLTKGIGRFQYRIRTELLVDCLKYFCVPFRDPNVIIHWVPSFSEYFSDYNDIDKSCQCIMKVSGPVSILFKKKDLAVWDTLGHIIGISPRNIVNVSSDK